MAASLNTAPIGYYVHHHGSGHMIRALQIVGQISRPVVLFSSRRPAETLPPHVSFVELPNDSVIGYTQPADSLFHYTPWAPQISDRYQVLLREIAQRGIRGMYVDVSVEIVALCKLLGLKVGVAAMHGRRTDRAHTTCYQMADFILWHNAPQFDIPTNRLATDKLYASGGIARFPKVPVSRPAGYTNILVVSSMVDGISQLDGVEDIARRYPDTMWDMIGPAVRQSSIAGVTVHGIVADPRRLYAGADLVIGSGGNNIIMEAAACGKPFVCIPEQRPYDEQRIAAERLQQLGVAVYLKKWPSGDNWLALLQAAGQLDLDGFSALVDDQAAATAADVIMRQFVNL